PCFFSQIVSLPSVSRLARSAKDFVSAVKNKWCKEVSFRGTQSTNGTRTNLSTILSLNTSYMCSEIPKAHITFSLGTATTGELVVSALIVCQRLSPSENFISH